ncbi:MAG: NAD(P)-dependent oxidoreductase [Clostridia bacterium]|nr:NAD(P)-dependent oxidoreductase [Clostridia bacterium]
MSKRVLLIAGGGTLGTYTAKELLSMGHKVDIICPEEKTSNDENLRFFRSMATYEYLSELLEKEHYDGIVNFVHYPDVE